MPSGDPDVFHLGDTMIRMCIGPRWCNKSFVIPIVGHPSFVDSTVLVLESSTWVDKEDKFNAHHGLIHVALLLYPGDIVAE